MADLPWLDYQGQTADELLVLAATHRADSLLCGLEQLLQSKEAEGRSLSPEEMVILVAEALQREVNNGGYHQFFINSSREYAPVVVHCLQQIGATEAVAITETALQALGVEEITPESMENAALVEADDEYDSLMAALEDCDQRYYQLTDMDGKLFAFWQANAAAIGR